MPNFINILSIKYTYRDIEGLYIERQRKRQKENIVTMLIGIGIQMDCSITYAFLIQIAH